MQLFNKSILDKYNNIVVNLEVVKIKEFLSIVVTFFLVSIFEKIDSAFGNNIGVNEICVLGVYTTLTKKTLHTNQYRVSFLLSHTVTYHLLDIC